MISLKKQLNGIGVLGINRRNSEYTFKYNSRDRYPLVDDKLQTKKLATGAGIAVPELYGVIETEYQVRHFVEMIEPYAEFALKPSRGSGGKGILVISLGSVMS